jgi:CubicO group peptidase (beta-lactamase class C family)
MTFPMLIPLYTNTSFTSFVSNRIFEPLNMSSTSYFPSFGQARGTAAHTFAKNGRRIPNWATDTEADYNAGAGGVVSSAKDLVEWVRLLLSDGHDVNGTKETISRSVLNECMRPQALIRGAEGKGPLPDLGPVTYGFGWMQMVYHGHRVSPLLSLPRRARN